MEAEVGVQLYETKLRRLLDKFLEKDFDIKNDLHFNLLVTQLSNKNDQKSGKLLVESQFFTEWLIKALEQWEETRSLPSVTIMAVTIHIVSSLSKNERRFVYFNSCNFYLRMCSVLKLRKCESSPSVRLAYIKLLASFLEHKSGVEWLIATDNWQDVLECCFNGRTIYIVRESKNFMYNLLLKSAEMNEIYSNIVVEKIVAPLVQPESTENGSLAAKLSEQSKKSLVSSVRLISHILQTYLESKLFEERNYKIPSLFVRNFHLEKTLWSVPCDNFDYAEVCVTNNGLLLSFFYNLVLDSEDKALKVSELKKLVKNIYNLINLNINRNTMPNLFEIYYFFYYYWNTIRSRIPISEDGSETLLCPIETQIICYQLCPLFVLAIGEFQLKLDEAVARDVFREIYISKLFKSMCPETIRMVYHLRDASDLLTQNECYTNAHKTIMYVVKSIPYLESGIGVIAFQCLAHILLDYIHFLKKTHLPQVPPNQSNFIEDLVDALGALSKSFNITWRESLETICILSASMELLTLTTWPEKTVSKILTLINISIAKFMPPNLALLVDRTNDSAMANLGTMLTEKLYSTDWEVRDSALEVLHTVCTIAHSMFPSFQDIVLGSDLPSLMVVMCQHDSERFVRASAIKCLQVMIKVPKFWNKMLDQQDLPEKMINILYKDTEANVRSEAATLISEIYEHQSIPKSMLREVNTSMVYAAASDLHWEVKLNALSYWQKVINNRLVNQGMIDGSFPSVTFSKENRKIVTLTETQIQTLLNKVLCELSTCGCLGVLLMTMQDDSDIEVAKQAVKITQEFANLLKLHNVTGTGMCHTPTSPKVVNNKPSFINDVPMTGHSDDVINSIVNCKDMGLLSNIYINGDVRDEPVANETNVQIKIVSPKEFVDFIHLDLNNLTAEKEKWLSDLDDLDSLLDDILKNYDCGDANAMDCY